jgi:GAF domain-containing protein
MFGSFGTPANPTPVQVDDPEGASVAVQDGALEIPREVQFDRVVTLAGQLFDAPITALVIVDSQGKWFRTSSSIETGQIDREVRFCRRAMQDDANAIVLDAQLDPRFADLTPMLARAKIRFGACAPLRVGHGELFAHMCVISPEPRIDFLSSDHKKLKSLADIVCLWIDLSRHVRRARTAAAEQIRALREANSRIKSSLEYATLLAEVQSKETPIDKLAIFGMAAWRQYTEAGGVLTSSMRSLRARMTAEEYRDLVVLMPGFAM